MAGKGSKPRPIPDKEKFDKEWDRIFGTKEQEKKKQAQDRRNG